MSKKVDVPRSNLLDAIISDSKFKIEGFFELRNESGLQKGLFGAMFFFQKHKIVSGDSFLLDFGLDFLENLLTLLQNYGVRIDVDLGLDVDYFVVIKLLLYSQRVLVVRNLAGVVAIQDLHAKVSFILLLRVINRRNSIILGLTLSFHRFFH